MAEIRLEALHKAFADFVAVERVDLRVENGQFFVLLGPSGCGKTTTLRMIAGLELPTTGTVRLDGQDVTTLRPAKRDIAFVFQLFALYPHMNVRRNMAYPLRSQGMPGAEIRQRVEETARAAPDRPSARSAGLGARRRRPPAGRARPRDRPPAARLPDGRAARHARCRLPRADVRGAARPARSDRRDHRLRHPRPDRGHGDGRRDRSDAQGRGAAGSTTGRDLPPAALACSSPTSSAARR